MSRDLSTATNPPVARLPFYGLPQTTHCSIFEEFLFKDAYVARTCKQFHKLFWDTSVKHAATVLVLLSQECFAKEMCVLYDMCELQFNCTWLVTHMLPPKQITHEIFLAFCRYFDVAKLQHISKWVPLAYKRPYEFASPFGSFVHELHLVQNLAGFLHLSRQDPEIPDPFALSNRGCVLDLTKVLEGVPRVLAGAPCTGQSFRLFEHYVPSTAPGHVLRFLMTLGHRTMVSNMQFDTESWTHLFAEMKVQLEFNCVVPPVFSRNELQQVFPTALAPGCPTFVHPTNTRTTRCMRSCEACLSRNKRTRTYRRCRMYAFKITMLLFVLA